MRTAIFRKPTFTDTIIPFTSNHPAHHKYTTVRYLYSRLNTYNLQQEEHQQELHIIHNILHNNSFPLRPHKPHTHNPVNIQHPTLHKNWQGFTYVGKETTYITNIFKRSELKITFLTTYTLCNMLIHKDHAPDRFFSWGVYKLICPDCHKAYVGQTGRQFSTRYKELKTAFLNNSNNSSFAKHPSDEPHSFGPINNITQIVNCHRKGAHLSTIERFKFDIVHPEVFTEYIG
jgi:hypothetical protein